MGNCSPLSSAGSTSKSRRKQWLAFEPCANGGFRGDDWLSAHLPGGGGDETPPTTRNVWVWSENTEELSSCFKTSCEDVGPYMEVTRSTAMCPFETARQPTICHWLQDFVTATKAQAKKKKKKKKKKMMMMMMMMMLMIIIIIIISSSLSVSSC
uniref:Uncharacterized protein n=1 Tax=Musa acuminata subsp. malaccensis TaxID=214687 RepID=A0A804IGY4_MUSAM